MAVLPSPARPRLLAILATAAAVLTGLLVATSPTPAHSADPGDEWVSPTRDLDCAGPMECVVFSAPYTGGETMSQFPTNQAWKLIPIKGSALTDDYPGHYQLRLMFEGDNGPDHACLTQKADQHVALDICAAPDGSTDIPFSRFPEIKYQAWWIEPVGTGSDRVVDPGTWNPWSHFGLADPFYLRPRTRANECLGTPGPRQTTNRLLSVVGQCGPFTELTLHQITDESDGGWKSPAARAVAQQRLLGAAFARAAHHCEQRADDNWCKVRATDRSGQPLSDWSRYGEIVLNQAPTPVIGGTGCAGGAGGGGAQSIYNGGTEPVTTTIGASATNETSQSVTTGLSFEAEFGFGKDSAFFKASFKVVTSVEYGKTWTDSQTVSQDISWTVPPRQYATAVLATTAANMKASWQFGPDNTNPWRIVNAADITVPYSANPAATGPDTTLAVFNSWSRKNCDATAPSTLADGRSVGIANTTAPGTAPIVGDTLEAQVGSTGAGDGAWWSIPTTGDEAPVTLRYQWYRVRGAEAPAPIPGARGRTYTVTGDDVTDPEILEWNGPYHIFVGVTDVATERRFDSWEYTSIGTGSVTEGPRRDAEGTLELTVANPDAPATKETRVDLAAAITGGQGAIDGQVTILDGSEEIAQATLGADGTKSVWLPLTVGPHDLVARYDGEGPLNGVRSPIVRTIVTAAPSTTSLVAKELAKVGDDITLRANVVGAGVIPTGSVEFFDGPEPLGDPVAVDGSGTATLTVPGLDRAGVRELWVSYSGNDVYAASHSAAKTQVVGARTTTTGLSVDPQPVHAGAPVTLTAMVATADDTTPVGEVRFTRDGASLGAPVPVTDGVATLEVASFVNVGPVELKAEFRGANAFAPSEAVRTIAVAPASTTATVRVPPLPSGHGDRVRLRGQVTSATGGIPTGRMVFFANGSEIGAREVDGRGVAVLRTTQLPRGTAQVWSRFQPEVDSMYGSSISIPSRHAVQRYASRIRAGVDDARLRKGQRVRVSGLIRLVDHQLAGFRGKIWLEVGGDRYDVTRIARDGAFRLSMPARRLDRGRNVVRVTYAGSRRPSVGSHTKRVVVYRR